MKGPDHGSRLSSVFDWPPLSVYLSSAWPTAHEEPDVANKAWRHFEKLLTKCGYDLVWPLSGVNHYIFPGDKDDRTLHDADHFPPALNPFCPQDYEALNFALFGRDYVWSGDFAQPVIMSAYDKQKRLVIVKAIRSDSSELQILEQLALPPLRFDGCNHTIPVLDVVRTLEWTFVVMPPWDYHPVSTPPCLQVKEYLDAAGQMLEGLAFMHLNLIAHMDILNGNIVLNHYIHGWDVFAEIPPPFLSAFDARFAFIDFGFSFQFPCDSPKQARLLAEKVFPGSYHFTPELGEPDWQWDDPRPMLRREDVFVDPFAADIWMLGRVLKMQFEAHERFEEGMPQHRPVTKEVRATLPQYLDLIADMMADDPTKRPTAAAALDCIRQLHMRIGSSAAAVSEIS